MCKYFLILCILASSYSYVHTMHNMHISISYYIIHTVWIPRPRAAWGGLRGYYDMETSRPSRTGAAHEPVSPPSPPRIFAINLRRIWSLRDTVSACLLRAIIISPKDISRDNWLTGAVRGAATERAGARHTILYVYYICILCIASPPRVHHVVCMLCITHRLYAYTYSTLIILYTLVEYICILGRTGR